ncbi:hypothetical protein ACWOFR_03330 [Carnobacterium gallinarum]|uniref:hypothetical protein n=1 Tax=Carnobacterium gallinarum TaxID=2749 RepID=UPI000690B172|nr:hypothetical protein [Carnobacterium gallinarum]
MKSILLTSDGDISISSGLFSLINLEEEVRQSIQSLLKIRLGEFYLDEHVGLDRSNLLGKEFNADEARDNLIECISQDDRVEVVNDLRIQVQGRLMSITFEAKLVSTEYEIDSTVTGEVQLNV